VCARYFETLDEDAATRRPIQPSTIAVLRAQGLAYVRFAGKRLSVPDRDDGVRRARQQLDVALNTSAFVHMRPGRALITEGISPPGRCPTLELELWTVPHGIAACLISPTYLLGRHRGIRRTG